MSKIKIYKNRYGKEPIVIGKLKGVDSGIHRPLGFTQQSVDDLYDGEMRRTKGLDYKRMVWCPYIPMLTTTVIPSTKWTLLKMTIATWLHTVCNREYESKYLMECLQDFYKNFGKKYILELRQYKYTDKTVNEKYFSKITTNDAKD